jgi:hypothetical protein
VKHPRRREPRQMQAPAVAYGLDDRTKPHKGNRIEVTIARLKLQVELDELFTTGCGEWPPQEES